MFILETTVSRVDIEGVSAACANVRALPVTVRNLASSVDAFDYWLCDLEATYGSEVGGGSSLSKNSRRNQNSRNGANGVNGGSGIFHIPWKIPGEVGGIKYELRYELAQHNPPPLPTSSELALELNIWTGITKPCQKLYALNDVAQGYLPRRVYWERCDIHTPHSSLWILLIIHLCLKSLLLGNQVQILLQIWLLFTLRLVLVLSSNTLNGWTLYW